MKNDKIKLKLKSMLGFRLLPDNHKSAVVSSAKVGDKIECRTAIEAKVGGKTIPAINAKVGTKPD